VHDTRASKALQRNACMCWNMLMSLSVLQMKRTGIDSIGAAHSGMRLSRAKSVRCSKEGKNSTDVTDSAQ
jgi:hypothetical protein